MKQGSGKRKGNAFERKIYKDLRAIDSTTKRTIGSGSSDEPGDILFKSYAIECKHYKQLTRKTLLKFYDKLAEEISIKTSETIERSSFGYAVSYFSCISSYRPVLIFRQNRNDIMVMENRGEILFYEDWLKEVR